MKPVRIGTRISALAMWQAQWVQNAISEIGIATGRLHARGPVGAAQLTSFKYAVRGSGQTRA